MHQKSTLRGALVGMLTLATATAFAMPVGPRSFVMPHASPAQTEPQAGPQTEAAPNAVTPPPTVPAPEAADDEPVVTLPPVDESQPGNATTPATVTIPGIPTLPNGTVFSFADLAAQLLDSVVYISTSQRVAVSQRTPRPPRPSPPGEDFFDEFFNDDENRPRRDPRTVQSLGSGFVIDPSGLIVTNNHVIADADEIVANFANGDKLTAEVIGVDDKTDLALIKVTAEEPLPATRFGRSEGLRVGDWVIAIGNPFGFGGTVTAGIVSALDRDINSGPYDHFIQTDASINRGNSGGPLFNLGGEVVGINTAIMSPTGGSIGIGFAVPTEVAIPVIEQLRRFGEVRRGWIGVRIQDVPDEVAASLGMDDAMGALIAGVTESGPADKAGLQEGDVVVAFNGQAVETMRELPQVVADTPPGDEVDVVVMRDGERVTLRIELGLLGDEEKLVAAKTMEEEEDKAPPQDAAAMFGLSLGPVTDEARKVYAIDDAVDGVLVESVSPGSEAEEKSVKVGEVILQVSQKDVSAPQEVIDRIEELKAEGRRTVMFLMSGEDNKLRFVSLRFEDEPETDEE